MEASVQPCQEEKKVKDKKAKKNKSKSPTPVGEKRTEPDSGTIASNPKKRRIDVGTPETKREASALKASANLMAKFLKMGTGTSSNGPK